MAKDEVCVIENINGIDEVILDVNTIPFQSHNFSNVENVHQQKCDNTADEMYFQATEQNIVMETA